MKTKRIIQTLALYVSCLVLFVGISNTGVATAISKEQRKVIDSGSLFYNIEQTPICSTSTNTPVSPAVSSTASQNIPEPHRTALIKAASAHSVNPNLLAALFMTEQGNKWKPFDTAWASSPVGASGPFQFMPGTWTGHKQDGNGDGVKDIQNFDDAAHAAGDMAAAQGISLNTPLGDINAPFANSDSMIYFAMAYNWGPGNVQKLINAHGEAASLDDINIFRPANEGETKNYASNIYELLTSDFTKSGHPKYGDPTSAVSTGDTSRLVSPQRQQNSCDQIAGAGISGGSPPSVSIPGGCETAAGYVNPKLGECVGIKSGTTLTDYNPGGDVKASIDISSSVDGKTIYGCVNITAPNVTISNSRIICYDSRDIFYDACKSRNGGNASSCGNGSNFRAAISSSASGTQILNNDIVCGKDENGSRDTGSAPCDAGIDLSNGTAAFNSIHHAVDGVNPGSNSNISFNFIWGLVVEKEEIAQIITDNYETGPWSHSDAVQIWRDGISGVEVHGNFIVGNDNADRKAPNSGSQGIITSNHDGAFGTPAKITNNIIMGPFRSAVLACWGQGPCNMSDNIIDQRYTGRGSTIQGGGGGTFSCNRFSNGAPLQKSNTSSLAGSFNASGCPTTDTPTGGL